MPSDLLRSARVGFGRLGRCFVFRPVRERPEGFLRGTAMFMLSSAKGRGRPADRRAASAGQ